MEIEKVQTTMSDAELRMYLLSGADISIDSNYRGAENMRRDEDRALELRNGSSNRTFIRFYSWAPWCVSLGANQNEEELDAEALTRCGFDRVRRATGGRAVLHADELTYSIVTRLPGEVSTHDVYRVSHEIIGEGLRALGASDVVFQRQRTDFAQRYRTEGDSVSCFTSAARSEIMWQNRKVVGSAQRRWSNVLLQHGSILLGNGHLQLADVVRVSDEVKREQLRSSMLEHSVSLQELCHRTIEFDEAAAALHRTFSQC